MCDLRKGFNGNVLHRNPWVTYLLFLHNLDPWKAAWMCLLTSGSCRIKCTVTVQKLLSLIEKQEKILQSHFYIDCKTIVQYMFLK